MYKNILIPVSLDHGSDVEKVVSIANRICDESAEITLISVLESPPSYVSASLPDDYLENAKKRTKVALRERFSERENIEIRVVDGHAAEVILNYAETTKVDCIIVESKHNAVKDFLLGSIAARIARRAQCTVIISR